MTNANPATTAASAASTGATIVQYAQGPDGQQYYIPGRLLKAVKNLGGQAKMIDV